MDQNVLKFVRRNLTADDVRGRTVLEAGSRAVGGPEQSVRPMLEALQPATYVGIDIEPGTHVDEICDAGELRTRFGDESFDVVVTTEMLEHARDWRAVVRSLKHVTKRGGPLVITTRSRGFPYHGWPCDYWRYEISDMEAIFSDFVIEALEPDLEAPGVCLKARKPAVFREVDISGYKLFSMVKQRRTASITARDERLFAAAYTPVRLVRASTPKRLKRAMKRTPLSREHRILVRTERSVSARGR
jgi:SAM-dependent methyltransferase